VILLWGPRPNSLRQRRVDSTAGSEKQTGRGFRAPFFYGIDTQCIRGRLALLTQFKALVVIGRNLSAFFAEFRRRIRI
jgi:hypothetical protein